ncbi:MAG: peptidoglycan bridge formation glycyltransferase FemA/FemB family protein, partial [Corynebacterium kroppenstedtii]|nr:peptidoglycan bridge formation glycyltransferase FemA/FemB family protein [Corynebacterium kroppenstedtii]
MPISARSISVSTMLEFIAARGSASFLQTPAWARVKSEWRGERVGFYDGDELTGVGLILYRKLPKLPRYLAYLPEGPVLDWSRDDIAEHFDALVTHVKKRQAFAVRIGPAVVHRIWGTKTIKTAIADDNITSLTEVEPDIVTPEGEHVVSVLKQGGWITDETGHGFAA